MLTQPLHDLAAWTAYFRQMPIPIMARSAQALADLAEAEEARGDVDAHRISQALCDDPLMTLKVLVQAAQHRHARQVTDAETITAAVIMLGIGPFLRLNQAPVVAEEHLAIWPEAWAGLQQVHKRAHRAARFALGFAIHRMESDTAVLHEAALLHDFAEMLLWCHAPTLARALALRQQAEPTLRSAQIQHELLNTTLVELEQSLMRAWRLPTLLIQLTNDRAEGVALVQPQMRLVKLAVQLARHSAGGWDNAALPDDCSELAELLNLSIDATRRLLHELDDDGDVA